MRTRKQPGDRDRRGSGLHWITGGKMAPRLVLLAGMGLGMVLASTAMANISQTPLLVVEGDNPNIMLMLDNSNSMVEGPGGPPAGWYKNATWEEGDGPHDVDDPEPGPDGDVFGAAHPLSKSEITRAAARQVIEDYGDLAQLGLMAYQQYPMDVDDGTTTENVVQWHLVNRLYDVSYDPNHHDEEFDLDANPWDSDTKRFGTANPSDPVNDIFYNVAIPGYSGLDPNEVSHCYLNNPDDTEEEPFRFRCYERKMGTNQCDPETGGGDGNWCDSNWAEYSGFEGMRNANLSDSARARGVFHWGHKMVAIDLDHPEWLSSRSPGPGYVHVPLAEMDDEHRQWLDTKLGTVHHDTGNPNLTTDPDEPLIAAGLTPIEGTILTLQDYMNEDSGSDFFGDDQGLVHLRDENGQVPDEWVPQACANHAVWLTDGMPSTGADGTPLADDPATALEAAANAAAELYDSTETRLHVIGFDIPEDGEVPPSALDDLAQAGGTDHAHNVADQDALRETLDELFRSITDEAMAASALTANSTQVQTGTYIFQGQYDTRDWSGDFFAIALDADAAELEDSVAWRASDNLNPATRDIYTWAHPWDFEDPANGTGLPFRWNALPVDLQLKLDHDPDGNLDLAGEERLEWLWGMDVDGFRERDTILGPIINSEPAVVADQFFPYREDLEDSSYAEFYNETITERDHMVYVGASDGMLHGFDVETGEERMAYVPRGVFDRLNRLPEEDYNHRFYVDGSPSVTDAHIDDEWKSVLVGSLGAGGSSVFALDVTDPDDFDEDSVLWEIDDSTPGFEDMGYSFSDPTVARLNDGSWVAIFGNGYGSDDGNALLYFVDLETGELLHELDTDTSGDNGMSSPLAVDTNLDGNAEVLVAGDLQGNLWKVDLSDGSSPEFQFTHGHNPLPLMRAESRDGEAQPITTRPVVTEGRNRSDRVYLFGTGQFHEVDDNQVPAEPRVESFYGVHATPDTDIGNDSDVITRGDMLQQSIREEGSDADFEFDYRVTSDENMETDHQGWFVDLAGNGGDGERVINDAVVVDGSVLFTTLIPESEPCLSGGTGWLMEVDAIAGGRLNDTFDMTGDGTIGDADQVDDPDGDGRVAVSGARSERGLPPAQPAVLDWEDSETGDAGRLKVVGVDVDEGGAVDGDVRRNPPPPPERDGRQSWQHHR